MDEILAKVLKNLRENNENSLFSLVSNIDDVEFTDGSIIITADSSAEYTVLNQNKAKLNAIAGGDYIVINKRENTKMANENLDKLRELFGEKLKNA
ncbi:MAG: hypothetical protein LBQ05_01785 [Christensenellaceae bacterium]|jgi:hypothetical protein|nr:hypothetical protein [Christensenellaceae bacterium]